MCVILSWFCRHIYADAAFCAHVTDRHSERVGELYFANVSVRSVQENVFPQIVSVLRVWFSSIESLTGTNEYQEFLAKSLIPVYSVCYVGWTWYLWQPFFCRQFSWHQHSWSTRDETPRKLHLYWVVVQCYTLSWMILAHTSDRYQHVFSMECDRVHINVRNRRCGLAQHKHCRIILCSREHGCIHNRGWFHESGTQDAAQHTTIYLAQIRERWKRRGQFDTTLHCCRGSDSQSVPGC